MLSLKNQNFDLQRTPISLLHHMSTVDLPRFVMDENRIELLRVLHMGGAAWASIPTQSRTLHGLHQTPATLLEITTPDGACWVASPPRLRRKTNRCVSQRMRNAAEKLACERRLS